VNGLESGKFSRLLSRVLQKLHLKDERAFSAEEEEKLQAALQLEAKDLELVLDTTSFILQQAAYHLAKPSVLGQHLQNIGLEEDKVQVFVQAWTAQGKSVVEKLRSRTFYPKQLEEVKWRLNLQMAQSSRSKMKVPNALFEFVVKEGEVRKNIHLTNWITYHPLPTRTHLHTHTYTHMHTHTHTHTCMHLSFTSNIFIAPSLRLTSSLVQEELGSTALESVHEYRLRTWLGHQEDNHRIVLYQADADLSPWTARCIRQADCILLVGLAEKGPSESMGQIVKQVEAISVRVQKELVLLHKESISHPSGTVKWLNALGWLSSYFHVRCPEYFFTWKLANSDEKALPPPLSRHSDFARLARRLTGTSVGLVLGGGGARGIAHIGALMAFGEAGR